LSTVNIDTLHHSPETDLTALLKLIAPRPNTEASTPGPDYLMAASFSASLVLPCTGFFIFCPHDGFRCLLFSSSFPWLRLVSRGPASLCAGLSGIVAGPGPVSSGPPQTRLHKPQPPLPMAGKRSICARGDVFLRFRPFFECRKLLFRACKGKDCDLVWYMAAVVRMPY
jgi:hypothetical protein